MFLIFFVIGCGISSSYGDAAVETFVARDAPYFDAQPLEESCAYQVYVNQYKDEMAKIQYLVNRIRYSESFFVRNKRTYNGYNAGQWLDFKIDKFNKEIATVEDFVEQVGSYSRRSGRPYHTVINGQRYAIKDVYYNELARLYNYEKQLAQVALLQNVNSQHGLTHSPEFSPSLSVVALAAQKGE